MKNKTAPISLRIAPEIEARVQKIAEKSGLAKAAILQLCIRGGLPEIESGRVNPLASHPPTAERIIKKSAQK
jgi:predicted DNA-binding protein